MSDLINREIAIKALTEVATWNSVMHRVAIDIIKKLPSAELNNKSTKLNRENDELISRQAVLSLAKDVILANGCKHRCIDATQIHELPSAEPKTGKWIRTVGDYIGDDVSGFYDYHWACSECEREAITNDWNMYELSDYCPHCGAKMEGE